ncbi:archaeosortase A [Haloferacaceae archaeon DSL9]
MIQDALAWIRAGLFTSGPLSDALIWLVVGLFGAAALLEWGARRRGWHATATARRVAAAAWVGFGLFWFNLIPFFAFEHQSYVEGILSVIAVPACFYAGKLLLSGRDTLFILSRAIAVMGLIYLPFETIPAFAVGGTTVPAPRQVLIEVVTVHTGYVISALGYTPELVESGEGFLATYRWTLDDGHIYNVSIVLACTGLGSMAIFGGLIAAVRAPLSRKLRALAVSIPIIYALNVARTSFISIATGNQYLHWFPDVVLFMFGDDNPYRVSFLVSDRIISQFLAVFALMGITYLVVRELPELAVVLEDVLYLLTGDEHDLVGALDLAREPTADAADIDPEPAD